MKSQIEEQKIILHQGVYKPAASVADAVFMITGMTIGAGVLGVPYVVAQVGLKIGIAYIIGLGLIMLFLNLVIGEIAVRTNESLQIGGLAGKYLGKPVKYFMGVVIVLGAYSSLLAYIIGEGQSLSSLFGGSAVVWSVIFWGLGSVVVWRGLQTIKSVEKVLSIIVITIICGLSFYFLKDFKLANWAYSDLSKIFLPYGVILFALNGTPAVIEAHALLPRSQRHFRKALIIGSLIPMVVYVLFALAVVGVTGLQTSEIATIGLGAKFGQGVLVLGNIFAILAMAGGFVGSGIALKQSFVWDSKLNKILAEFLVISVPILLFVAGLRQFISVLSIAGGGFIGIEAVILIVVCWQARRKGDLDAAKYQLHHFWVLAAPVFLFFSWITIASFVKFLR
ncbi:MAG TPA: aromatic amino acid transport family protein [Candidatus Udaeobacter sp.]|nr:aromatic amino acid transport family protein [Candidatus Udaeobacter sp.]